MVRIGPAPVSSFFSRQQDRPIVQRMERWSLYALSAGVGAMTVATAAVASRSHHVVETAIQTLSTSPHFNATAIARGAAFIVEKGILPSVSPPVKYGAFIVATVLTSYCVYKQARCIGAKHVEQAPSSPRIDRIKTD